MAKVEFNYDGEIIEVLCLESDKMEDICKKFTIKAKIDQNISKYNFLYSGNVINVQLTFSQIISSMDKERKIISLLVIDTEKSTLVKSPKIIKFPFPICKECGENMKFELEGYKIRCAECPNFHTCDMLLKEYENYQKIDISKILCDICSTSKYKTYNNQMYICNTCKIKLCPLCKNKHDKNHKTTNYDLKNYICPRHNESYISFCKTCNINICFNCQIDHNMHDIILFGDILPIKDELCIKLIEFKDTIDEFNEGINKIIDIYIMIC